jgi:hypothetical protein
LIRPLLVNAIGSGCCVVQCVRLGLGCMGGHGLAEVFVSAADTVSMCMTSCSLFLLHRATAHDAWQALQRGSQPQSMQLPTALGLCVTKPPDADHGRQRQFSQDNTQKLGISFRRVDAWSYGGLLLNHAASLAMTTI